MTDHRGNTPCIKASDGLLPSPKKEKFSFFKEKNSFFFFFKVYFLLCKKAKVLLAAQWGLEAKAEWGLCLQAVLEPRAQVGAARARVRACVRARVSLSLLVLFSQQAGSGGARGGAGGGGARAHGSLAGRRRGHLQAGSFICFLLLCKKKKAFPFEVSKSADGENGRVFTNT